MGVVLVEGISDRIALEAVAAKLELRDTGREIVPIGGAHAVARAAERYRGRKVAGLCDAGEQDLFRRALGDAVFVCDANLEDELIRALGPDGVERVVAAAGELETFRKFQNQPAWRGRPVEAQLLRWLHNGGRYLRYPPLFVAALEPERIPRPLAGVLAAV